MKIILVFLVLAVTVFGFPFFAIGWVYHFVSESFSAGVDSCSDALKRFGFLLEQDMKEPK